MVFLLALPSGTCVLLTEQASQTVTVLEPQEDRVNITLRGSRPLWSELLSAYQGWLKAGRQVMQMRYQGHDASFVLSIRDEKTSKINMASPVSKKRTHG